MVRPGSPSVRRTARPATVPKNSPRRTWVTRGRMARDRSPCAFSLIVQATCFRSSTGRSSWTFAGPPNQNQDEPSRGIDQGTTRRRCPTRAAMPPPGPVTPVGTIAIRRSDGEKRRARVPTWPGTRVGLELVSSRFWYGVGAGFLGESAARGSGLLGFLLGDQATNPFREQSAVERLLERVVEAQREGLLAGFVAGERQQNGALVVGALA